MSLLTDHEMDDDRFTSHLYQHPFPSQALRAPGKTLDTVESTPPPKPDKLGILNRDETVAMKTPSSGTTRMPTQTLTITPPKPASPTLSDADSECFDETSNSPCSFAGEECPDLCGGFKNACRSWTPPASPFYYTNEGGIFLLDDRQKYEERQKIELEHSLRDLDARLQRLRVTISPPRCLSRLHECGHSPPSSPSEKLHVHSERFPRAPTETLAEHSQVTTTSPQPSPCDCGGTPHRCKHSTTQHASTDSLHDTINTKELDETGTADIGRLIHTSLQHVQSTNSPPRYLAKVSEIEILPLLREPTAFPNPQKQLRDEALLTRHTSPQLHFGNTAYPTPLPSSPESKPIRKRRRDDARQESSARKRRREEDDMWFST